MGDPKRQRKKYVARRFPWLSSALNAELQLLGEYGLRNKRELRRHYAMLSKYRRMARELLGEPIEKRSKLEKQLLNKLRDYKILSMQPSIDDVLDLTIQNILERRLQTLIFKLGLAKTPQQARQLITHGHIAIKGRKISSPSYIVKAEEEQQIQYASTSPFARDSGLIQKEASTTSPEQQENV